VHVLMIAVWQVAIVLLLIISCKVKYIPAFGKLTYPRDKGSLVICHKEKTTQHRLK